MRLGVRRITALTACSALLLGLTTLASSSSSAAPSRDIEQVEAQVLDLEMRAASAAERANAAQVELDQTQARLDSVRNKVDREQQELATARASVNDLARGVYMSGGMDTTLQVLLADDPTDFLAQSAALDQVAQAQAASMRRTQTAQLRLAQSQAELADQEQLAQGHRNEMAAAQQAVESNLSEAEAVLASLQEEERRRLEELRAQREREEAAAAEQARRDLAAAQAAADANQPGADQADEPDAPEPDSPGEPEPSEEPQGPSASGGGFSGGGRAMLAVEYALAQVGKTYVAAGDGPSSFDCSGLTMMAWRQAGVSLPHYSYSQWGQVRRIPDSELQPGDLVFYFGSGAHHVAMYIGNGKMVSASNPRDGVEIIDYKGPWYGERYSGAGRVIG